MYNNWNVTNQSLNSGDYSSESQHGLNQDQQRYVGQRFSEYQRSGYPINAVSIPQIAQVVASELRVDPRQVLTYVNQRPAFAPQPEQIYNNLQPASHQDVVNSLGGQNYLYRGDSRNPDEIFRPTTEGGGFHSRGNNMDLEQWVGQEQTHDSGYISTSRDYDSARESAFGNTDPEPAVGYVYSINHSIPGQHDVNAQLGHLPNVSPEEQEIAIARRISASNIRFATEIHNYPEGSEDGVSHFNPHWKRT